MLIGLLYRLGFHDFTNRSAHGAIQAEQNFAFIEFERNVFIRAHDLREHGRLQHHLQSYLALNFRKVCHKTFDAHAIEVHDVLFVQHAVTAQCALFKFGLFHVSIS